MSDTTLPRDFWAEPAPNRSKWIGKFQAPGLGVRTVRGVGRSAQQFDTQIEAEIAAARAKDQAEDEGRAPRSKSAKEFRPRCRGRSLRMESAR